MRKETVILKDGTSICGNAFDRNDFLLIQKIFQEWLTINSRLKSLGGRNINVPDVLSESLFCLAFNAIRTNGTGHSYDCVMRETGEAVQLKSASIKNDCSSFGPKSTWDLLFFADFAPNGKVDGLVNFYKIDDSQIYDLILNTKKNETFRDQQSQGRRPRLSIQKSIIKANDLRPIKRINLITGEGI